MALVVNTGPVPVTLLARSLTGSGVTFFDGLGDRVDFSVVIDARSQVSDFLLVGGAGSTSANGLVAYTTDAGVVQQDILADIVAPALTIELPISCVGLACSVSVKNDQPVLSIVNKVTVGGVAVDVLAPLPFLVNPNERRTLTFALPINATLPTTITVETLRLNATTSVLATVLFE